MFLQGWPRIIFGCCDLLTDIIHICDVLLQFRLGYLEEGIMVIRILICYAIKSIKLCYVTSLGILSDFISQILIFIKFLFRFGIPVS